MFLKVLQEKVLNNLLHFFLLLNFFELNETKTKSGLEFPESSSRTTGKRFHSTRIISNSVTLPNEGVSEFTDN